MVMISLLSNSLLKIALMTTCDEDNVVGTLIHLSSSAVPLSFLLQSGSLSLSTESVDKDSPLSDEFVAAS